MRGACIWRNTVCKLSRLVFLKFSMNPSSGEADYKIASNLVQVGVHARKRMILLFPDGMTPSDPVDCFLCRDNKNLDVCFKLNYQVDLTEESRDCFFEEREFKCTMSNRVTVHRKKQRCFSSQQTKDAFEPCGLMNHSCTSSELTISSASRRCEKRQPAQSRADNSCAYRTSCLISDLSFPDSSRKRKGFNLICRRQIQNSSRVSESREACDSNERGNLQKSQEEIENDRLHARKHPLTFSNPVSLFNPRPW